MLWTEVRKWAKEKGYEVSKEKETNEYFWSKENENGTKDSGVALSVSKLARAIYNHITDNKWLEHQENFKNNMNGIISGDIV